jgi:hypothetical protein
MKTDLTSWTGKIDIIILYNTDFKDIKSMNSLGT